MLRPYAAPKLMCAHRGLVFQLLHILPLEGICRSARVVSPIIRNHYQGYPLIMELLPAFIPDCSRY